MLEVNMSSPAVLTDFAPAERAATMDVVHAANFFSDLALVNELFSAVPNVFLILNQHRQIVFANKSMLRLLGVTDANTLYGLRPGEALECVHATERIGGCGTTEFCKNCGAVQAILTSLRGKETVQECRITQRNGNSLDLRVWATPLQKNGDTYSLFAVQDISHEKRRRVLERIFFHDILNTAGGLQGVSELLQDASLDEADELKGMVYSLADRLVEEIQAQRLLSAAENDDLTAQPVLLDSLSFLREVTGFYHNHEVARYRVIEIAPGADEFNFTSDRTLLGRVIGNLLKNALEAAKPGDTITLGCRLVDVQTIEFWVHNPTFIPRNVQLQVFQRSFSTKGPGRGLGTYSIKLLTERYLKGNVEFTTSPEQGTTFFARYPRTLE
jgi:signal transduction histidine kinase